MKNKLPLLTFFLVLSLGLNAQDVNLTAMGLPRVNDVNTITGEAAANIGNVVYNTADDLVYRYNGVDWVVLENASEVPMVVNVDVNNDPTIPAGTASPTPALETNVEDVIQAIAPITSKAGRVFFPPSIEIDASTLGVGNLDLHDLYEKQYTLNPDPIGPLTPRTASSAGAPGVIPTYTATELYYYVTYADPTIFDNITIDEFGMMSYEIVGIPTDDNTIINVVFVVK